MLSLDDTGVLPKHQNKLCKHMLAEPDLIMKSPVVPISKFIYPVLAS